MNSAFLIFILVVVPLGLSHSFVNSGWEIGRLEIGLIANPQGFILVAVPQKLSHSL